MFDPIDNFKNILRKAATIEPNASYNCFIAKVVSIQDPERLGRCKVQLFSSVTGSVSYASDWCAVLGYTLFNGLLPKSLLDQIVLVFPIKSNYESCVISLFNPLIYSLDESLPEPNRNNLGMSITVLGSSESFIKTCQLRNGVFTWESLCPLNHGHTGGHTQAQDRDSSFDLQMPIAQQPINDQVFGTSVNPYIQDGNIPPVLT